MSGEEEFGYDSPTVPPGAIFLAYDDPARVFPSIAAAERQLEAMDLEEGVFKSGSAHKVALSLKRSAEASQRRKSTPFRSAMSMLNFEINRGGKNLSAERKRVLSQAKVELRKVFHREPARP